METGLGEGSQVEEVRNGDDRKQVHGSIVDEVLEKVEVAYFHSCCGFWRQFEAVGFCSC